MGQSTWELAGRAAVAVHTDLQRMHLLLPAIMPHNDLIQNAKCQLFWKDISLLNVLPDIEALLGVVHGSTAGVVQQLDPLR